MKQLTSYNIVSRNAPRTVIYIYYFFLPISLTFITHLTLNTCRLNRNINQIFLPLFLFTMFYWRIGYPVIIKVHRGALRWTFLAYFTEGSVRTHLEGICTAANLMILFMLWKWLPSWAAHLNLYVNNTLYYSDIFIWIFSIFFILAGANPFKKLK